MLCRENRVFLRVAKTNLLKSEENKMILNIFSMYPIGIIFSAGTLELLSVKMSLAVEIIEWFCATFMLFKKLHKIRFNMLFKGRNISELNNAN